MPEKEGRPLFCPKGAAASSPGLRSYPGNRAAKRTIQPQRGCGGAIMNLADRNAVGVRCCFGFDTQGSRCAATLGWRTQPPCG